MSIVVGVPSHVFLSLLFSRTLVLRYLHFPTQDSYWEGLGVHILNFSFFFFLPKKISKVDLKYCMIGFQSIVVVNFQLFQKNEYVTILKWKTSDPDVPLPYQHHPHIIVGPSSVLRRILPKLPQNLIFRKLNGPSSWIKIFMYFYIFKFWKLHQACSHVCPSWLTYQLFQKKKNFSHQR